MRISTQSIYENGTNRLNDLQATLDKTARQVSTGRRILTPSDDPIGSAQAQDVSQSQALNQQYAFNRQNAESQLGLADSVLGGVTELLQSVKTLVVDAGNGSYKDSDRASVAKDLRSRFDELLSLANSADGNGNYLFSGFQVSTAPFVKTATGAAYQGDQGQRLSQIDASRQIALTDNGTSIFQSNGQDVFATLSAAIGVLETAVVNQTDRDALTAGLAAANNGVDRSLESVLSTRASIGARLREVDAFNVVGSSKDLNYQETLSNLLDLDYNEAISRLSKQQVILQAAQKTFTQVSDLSLFNYI